MVRFRVRDAAHAKDRTGRRVTRGVASNCRVNEAGTVLEAIVLWSIEGEIGERCEATAESMTPPGQPKISDLPHTRQLTPILCVYNGSSKGVV